MNEIENFERNGTMYSVRAKRKEDGVLYYLIKLVVKTDQNIEH